MTVHRSLGRRSAGREEHTLNGRRRERARVTLNLSPNYAWRTMLYQRRRWKSRGTRWTNNWAEVSLKRWRNVTIRHAQGIRRGGPYVCGYEEGHGQCGTITNDGIKDCEPGPIALLFTDRSIQRCLCGGNRGGGHTHTNSTSRSRQVTAQRW